MVISQVWLLCRSDSRKSKSSCRKNAKRKKRLGQKRIAKSKSESTRPRQRGRKQRGSSRPSRSLLKLGSVIWLYGTQSVKLRKQISRKHWYALSTSKHAYSAFEYKFLWACTVELAQVAHL